MSVLTLGLTEVAANNHSDTITELEQQVSQLRKEVVGLMAKTENLEARSRRCNLHIFGIKEIREEGTRTTTFVAGILQKALKLDKPPILHRAHHILQMRRMKGSNQEPLWSSVTITRKKK